MSDGFTVIAFLLFELFTLSVCMHASCFSCVQLFAILWTIAHQVPLSMGFSRQEYWSGLPCPPSRGSSRSRDWILGACISWIGRQVLYRLSHPEICHHILCFQWQIPRGWRRILCLMVCGISQSLIGSRAVWVDHCYLARPPRLLSDQRQQRWEIRNKAGEIQIPTSSLQF